MNVRITVGSGLIAANLIGWAVILATRDATSWAELESRRPKPIPHGIAFEANTAWGLPLFGREVGGCFRETRLASGFMLLNFPGLLAAMIIEMLLEMSPLKMSVISWLMGLAVLGVSAMQWYLVGKVVTRVRRARTAPA